MIRRPPRSTLDRSSAASDVYKRQLILTPPVREGKAIKVRLDSRTVVMVKNPKALAFWKERYPKAEVIKD